ncbi:MAG TPA: DUF3488 and transglutaminase-like domain-containing protein [Geobacteraceae bacterium]|nr:DUF3488 and transglutaminase-like domain-containing protein [Geobacteraceae bacterium]
MANIRTVLDILAYGIALLGFVPLFPYLENIPRILFPAALACGIIADRKRLHIRAWIPTVISFIFFAFYAAQFSRNNLVGPAVNLLVILLSIRLFSEKTPRNYLQIFALALFSFTSSSLFNLSPVFLVYLFLILVLIAVALVFLTFYSASSEPLVTLKELKQILSTALVMPLAALPLMLVLFIILPRTQFPLWNFLNISGARVTGLSEKVDPGSAPSVGEVKNVAFRANCERLAKARLYWRGIVLNAFEGTAWVRRQTPSGEEGRVVNGPTVRQTIYPEPGKTAYLVALNIPRTITGVRSSTEQDYTSTARGGGIGRIKYEAVSVAGDTIEMRKGIDRNFYLTVPGGLSGRLLELGRGIGSQGKSDEEKISLLEREFAARKLRYTTVNLPGGDFPLDDFLFQKRRGHCEFFASSFAVLLRLAGVPARLVGGYYGGEYNDIGGYYVVTEDMAHVWVEAFVQGKGWVMIDPSTLSVNFPVAGERAQKSLAQRLGMAIDAFSYYWNVTVINYDLERQMRLINNAGVGLRTLSIRAFLKNALSLALLACAVAIVVFMVKRRRRSSPEKRILAKFLTKVAREYRMQISPETGLHELSATLDNPAVSRFVAIYGNAVYHDRSLAPDEMLELEVLLRELPGPKISPGSGFDAGIGKPA